MNRKEIDQLFRADQNYTEKLQSIATNTIKDEKLIVSNLLNPPQETLTKGQSLSDKIARFGGSWMFIITFFVILVVWIAYNSILPSPDVFDPYPFILMNLVLSCIAALQAPVIMMSQNRHEEKDRQRAQNDYLINLKAELEIRSLHQKMDLVIEDQLKTLYEIQLKQLDLLKGLQEQIDKKQP